MKLIIALILLALFATPISAQGTYVTAIGNDGSRIQYAIQDSAEDEINQAIDFLSEAGGVVELSKGTFNITASGTDYIKVHQSNVILEGQGKKTVLKGMSGGNNVVVELLALEGEQVENVGISNLSITTAPDCYACGLGIGTLDADGTLTNAWAEDLWIHDINWHPDVGGGKGITIGSFTEGSVDYVYLKNIKVWGCGFYGIDTSHNYVIGGIKNLKLKNIDILRSYKNNLFILGVDGFYLNRVVTDDSNGNGAIFSYCNDVCINRLRSTGNGARGLLAELSSNIFIYQSRFKDNVIGVDIDDCTGYVCLFRSKIIGNEVGMDVDNTLVNLIKTVVRKNELDYRVINGGVIQ